VDSEKKVVVHIHLRAASFDILALFLHNFDWEVTVGIKENEIVCVKNWPLLIKFMRFKPTLIFAEKLSLSKKIV